ncbi:phage tail sheath family protein [Mariniflexile sp. AS56]|uniref:phage tail sheath family protein n=1 Tax=Mariniflexile sp. AS56 TaxID=3063957 RepID=UPI0026EEA065|nr:phage tail sheath C-terminal domain-containing protein [Mariniflexile sp. AS56]MDO7174068.1 phage tail sheath C-terminal domain-containing protein [Mariniflexile sp. AS56]
MANYKTPGVYIEEIVKFPPSVAQVETAIPAFIGYTEKATNKIKGDLKGAPTRITSMLEYETYFGFAKPERTIAVKITDTLTGGNPERTIIVTQPSSREPFLMYYSLQMYFANGGGPCYITSVGRYGDTLDTDDTQITSINNSDHFTKGLAAIRKVDEPTLILFPDATALSTDTEFYSLYNEALKQCKELHDRFTIIDTRGYDGESPTDPNIQKLRNELSSEKDFLKYGAAYYPFLKTILNYNFNNEDVIISHIDEANPTAKKVITENLNAINMPTAVNRISNKTGATDLTGTLAEVYNYLFSDNDVPNEGLNLGENGTAPNDVKNYDNPRPLILHNRLTALLNDLNDLIENKKKANIEANAAVSALKDEVPVIDVSTINNSLSAFNDLFTTNNTIEPVTKELEKLTVNLKKFIDEANITKIQNVVENNTSNILEEIQKLVIGAPTSSPVANTNTTLFDGIGSAWDALKSAIIDDDGDDLVDTDINLDTNNGELHGRNLATIENLNNKVYNQILTEIGNLPLELPPSSSIAGVYARVDSDRGVWKAPANVSLNYVIEPSVQVTHDDQKDLNVDTVAGKSINVIRAFVGKGNLVWGARTLAGNDNEWRYISVRRFFNMAEESIKKATEQFVFEPNDKNTWVRVKAMIDNFLTQQWKAGALAGPTPEKAFYVNVGLGITMTALDILEGNMVIEIGMAVVRPAEFIVLKFSHKMQEA